jgi:hypothetical protein
MPAQPNSATRRDENPPFSSEGELVERLLQLLPGLFREGRKHLHVAVEVNVGRAIADIVAVVSSKALAVTLWPLSIRDSVVLAALRRGGSARIDLLEMRCGLPRYSFRNGTLNRLEEAGLIRRSNGGKVELVHDWLSSVSVVAIEAKLAAWRDAVRQAQEYLRYADEAYVALPRTTVSKWAIDVFTTAGVGLLRVGAGEVETIVRARRQREHDWRREFAVSRVLSSARITDD